MKYEWQTKRLFIPETWDDEKELSKKDIKDIIDNYERIMRLKFEMERMNGVRKKR